MKTFPEKPLIWVVGQPNTMQESIELMLSKQFDFRFFKQPLACSEILESTIPQDQLKPELILAEILSDNENIFDTLFKESRSPCPFFILSKHNQSDLIHLALDRGALDYLVHPVDGNLLKVKIERFFKQACDPHPLKSRMGLNSFSLAVSNSTGKAIQLTLKEFKILSLLHRSLPAPVSRDALQSMIWGEMKVSKNTLDVHIFNLRRKLEQIGFEVSYSADQTYCLVEAERSN